MSLVIATKSEYPREVYTWRFPGVGDVIAIWDKALFKLTVYFDGQVIRKKVYLESSNRIERHLDVVIEFLEIQSSVSFEFCLGEELIKSW